MTINYNNIPRGFKNESFLPKRSSIYMGLVRKNLDPQRMGRLLVWVSDFGPDSEDYWMPVSYASPFAGATPVKDTKENGLSMADSQQTYGFWATPPDIDNQVLVCFLDGDIANGFWFACIYPQNMNHMIPGIGFDIPTTDEQMDQRFAPLGPPVVEYNKNDQLNEPTATYKFEKEKVKRPVFTPLAEGLLAQGLAQDPKRGPSNTSARRESPSRVYGLLSPRGNNIHIDDGHLPPTGGEPEEEFIRFRTRSGTQVLISESQGFIYLITKGGNSWVEISDDAIDMYSANSISLNSDKDINFNASGNVNINGDAGIRLTSAFYSSLTTGDTNIASNGKVTVQASKDIGLKSGRDVALEATRDVGENAGRNILHGACGYSSRNAKTILDNAGGAPPPEVENAKFEKTPISRKPMHEPWDRGGMGGSSGLTPDGLDSSGNPYVDVTLSDGTTVQQPVTGKPAEIMLRLYKKMISLGWTPEGARTMVAQIGRENDYRPGPMFGAHTDASNGAKNVGIISWQGSRRVALLKYLKQKGCVDASGGIIPDWKTLDSQVEFMDYEMRRSYKKTAQSIKDPNQTYNNKLEIITSDNYVGWARGGSKNKKFKASDSDRALKKMNNYYANIRAATKSDG